MSYYLFFVNTVILGSDKSLDKKMQNKLTSRNQKHYRCFEAVKQLLGDRPLVLDREFSYEQLMEIFYIEQIQFVIRLNLGDQHRQPRLIDADGEPIKLFIKPGETIIRRNGYYLGTVKVNLIGTWRKSLSKPLWIITSLDPERGLAIYQQRMKIEQTFKDCIDLLHLAKLMNKQQRYLEQNLIFRHTPRASLAAAERLWRASPGRQPGGRSRLGSILPEGSAGSLGQSS
jgi:hypothetical protein